MNKKNTIIVVAAILGVGVLYLLLKKPKSQSNTIVDSNDDGIDYGTGEDGTENNGFGVVDTNTGLDYNQLANKLYQYMNGYGTDYTSIYTVLGQLKNQNDWNKLQSAYGVRTLSSGFGNIFVDDFNGNLKGALYDELSSNEYKKAIQILKDKGINF